MSLLVWHAASGLLLIGVGLFGLVIQPEVARKFGSLAVSMIGVVVMTLGVSSFGPSGKPFIDGNDLDIALVYSLLLEGLLIWALLAVVRRRGIDAGGELDADEGEE